MTNTINMSDLVDGAKADRNRAVDFYKAAAMVAVAFGHWIAIAVFTDADGEIIAKNALEFDYSLAWLTWALQVMPLFFLAGGFSSAVPPWRASMVDDGGEAFLPTHPPSIALMLFGMAYCATAVFLAPSINTWLARSKTSFTVVAVLGGVGMSVYLWHFTAAVIAGVGLLFVDGLPTAEVGTPEWWVQKLPLIGLSFVVLLVILRFVKRFEVEGLLADKAPYRGSMTRMLVSAALLSTGVKLWTGGTPTKVVIGLTITTLIWHLDLRSTTAADPSPVEAA